MLDWLASNLINIVLIAALIALFALIIRWLVRNKKAGISSCGVKCGGGCSGCGAAGGCSGGCTACGAPSDTHKSSKTA